MICNEILNKNSTNNDEERGSIRQENYDVNIGQNLIDDLEFDEGNNLNKSNNIEKTPLLNKLNEIKINNELLKEDPLLNENNKKKITKKKGKNLLLRDYFKK